MESVDYGDTDFRFEMEGESRNYDQKEESFNLDGFQKEQFSENGELKAVEDEDEMFEDSDFEDSFDE